MVSVTRLTFSVVILTFNRNHLLRKLLGELEHLAEQGLEVIVVDNHSDQPAIDVVDSFRWASVVRADRNLGAAGRNLGFEKAKGDIVICLDDDVSGLTCDALAALHQVFKSPHLGAVNFRVVEERSGRIVNWVHHRAVERYSELEFETYEITEGAVAFRRVALEQVGGYPASFFLSHEGPDLAFRLINASWKVIYSPNITVTHSFAQEGRASWRNYYFDTRNTLWLALRNLPFVYGLKLVMRQNLAMLVYSVRDGYLRWWFRAVFDSLKGAKVAWRERSCLGPEAMSYINRVDSFRPTLMYTLRRRFFQRDMKL